MRTTGGCGSKASVRAAVPFGGGFDVTAGVEGALAVAQAAGFAMPAFIKAAEIFCCCVMSAALVGPCSGESWITRAEAVEIALS